jgi:ribose 5-phosphate isomerase A
MSPSQAARTSFSAMAIDVINKHLNCAKIVGLGSGSTVAQLVQEMSRLPDKNSIRCIPTSLQIKIEAERAGLVSADESLIPLVDVVFDGADQIDFKFNMIKGGGGALLREKVLISSAKKVIIMADSSKYVEALNRSVPVEVHPFARASTEVQLRKIGGTPSLRVLEKGYPFVTENGNVIFDTLFKEISKPSQLETQIKFLPGVQEAGIFTRKPDFVYLTKQDGSFESIATPTR